MADRTVEEKREKEGGMKKKKRRDVGDRERRLWNVEIDLRRCWKTERERELDWMPWVGHDICQGSIRFKDKRECPTLFPRHKCNDDDLEMLCKTSHVCIYVDTQVSNFYGHVMLGLMIHLLYFSQPSVSEICSFYQFVHSSESILGVRKNFHSIYPSNVYTHFFQKLVMISEKLFQRKVGSCLFSQACLFFS